MHSAQATDMFLLMDLTEISDEAFAYDLKTTQTNENSCENCERHEAAETCSNLCNSSFVGYLEHLSDGFITISIEHVPFIDDNLIGLIPVIELGPPRTFA